MLGDAGSRVLAIAHARRGQHGSSDDLAAVAQREMLVARVDSDAGHFEGRQKFGAEPLRLCQGAAREFTAADAGREAEIVLDPRAGAGLAARRMAIDEQRAQTFRRAVHRRREAGRPGADDDQIVDVVGGCQRPAKALGDLPRLRIAEERTILEEQERQALGAHRRRVEQRARLGIALDVDPVIRQEAAGEEVLDRVRSR